jgi:hypothetical protein
MRETREKVSEESMGMTCSRDEENRILFKLVRMRSLNQKRAGLKLS